MSLSHRTLALLAQPFAGGEGPSHTTIEMVWAAAGAADYLPEGGNKVNRVLGGLQALQAGATESGLPADPDKLQLVIAALATRLIAAGDLDPGTFDAALERDGFAIADESVIPVRPRDEPADRLAEHLSDIFGDRDEFAVARNHFDQGSRAFDRGDYEAANAQFRSACDATFDTLAHARGCPRAKTGGAARQWLQAQDLLATDEADLTRTFMAFAGRAGSHAGLSSAADAQLRRHFATALIVFAIGKLSS